MKDASIYNQHPEYLGRFVHKVQEDVKAIGAKEVAEFLLDHVFVPFDNFEQEEFVGLLLNNRKQLTYWVLISRGTPTAALVRPACVFRTAVRANATGIIVAHNHPSGDSQFSDDDILCTQRLVQAAQILDIQFHDHIVVGRDSWQSMRQRDSHIFEAHSEYDNTPLIRRR